MSEPFNPVTSDPYMRFVVLTTACVALYHVGRCVREIWVWWQAGRNYSVYEGGPHDGLVRLVFFGLIGSISTFCGLLLIGVLVSMVAWALR